MELNRAVALDYPQVNVRWFHQKYVENVERNRKFFKNCLPSKVSLFVLFVILNSNFFNI